MKKNTEKRLLWIDIARGMAIFLVVLCHVVENVYQLNIKFMLRMSLQTRIFAFSAFTLGRIGVPLFLMISGYLLLARTYDTQETYSFWRKHLCGLLLTYEIWVILYDIFLSCFAQKEYSTGILLKNIFFTEQVDFDVNHIWYVPMILGIYLFLPFVANMLHKTDEKILKIPYAIAIIYLFLVPVISVVLQMCGKKAISSVLDLSFSGGVYGCYLICGYLIRQGKLKKVPSGCLVLSVVVLFVAVAALQLFSYQQKSPYNIWYNNVLLFICAAAIFELFSRMSVKQLPKVAGDLSRCSFGIYLVHNPILMVLNKYVSFGGCLPLKVAQLWGCTVVISWLVVSLLGRIPKLGRVLFYMR